MTKLTRPFSSLIEMVICGQAGNPKIAYYRFRRFNELAMPVVARLAISAPWD